MKYTANKNKKRIALTLITLLCTSHVLAATPVEELAKVGVTVETNPNVLTEQYDWIQGEDQDIVSKDINFWLDRLPYEEDKKRNRYIVIPRIGVVAPINNIYEDNDDYERIKFGKAFELNKYLQSWILRYPMTGHPGKNGNMVLFGHSSYLKSDKIGRYKTIFTSIPLLQAGDKIWVYTKTSDKVDFKHYEYIVHQSYQTSASDVSVLNQTKRAEMTLIGCTPIGTADARWAVKAIKSWESQNYTITQPIADEQDNASKIEEALTTEETEATQDTNEQEAGLSPSLSGDVMTGEEEWEVFVLPETIPDVVPVESNTTVELLPLTQSHEQRMILYREKIQELPIESQKNIINKLEKYFIYAEKKVPQIQQHINFMKDLLQ